MLVSGPNLVYESLDLAVEKAFKDNQSDTQNIPVVFMWTFRNFDGFEGFAMAGDYSSQPDRKSFLIMEGITIYVTGV